MKDEMDITPMKEERLVQPGLGTIIMETSVIPEGGKQGIDPNLKTHLAGLAETGKGKPLPNPNAGVHHRPVAETGGAAPDTTPHTGRGKRWPIFGDTVHGEPG